MKFFRKTVFWVIVLAVLAGTFYIFNKEVEEKKAVEEEKKKLFHFDPEDVALIAIRKPGQKDVVVKRVDDDAWVITSPVDAPGDKKNIEKFLKDLVMAKTDAVLFEEPPEGKLEELGLKTPYLKVELQTDDGRSKTVHFGNFGPTHNIAYASIEGDTRVFRINSDIRTDSDKGAYYFRDKTILTFDPLKVKTFEIKWKDGEDIVIEHPEEGKWDAVGLPAGRTDFVKLMELVVLLKKGKIKAFADDNPKDLARYGLDDPRVQFIFTDKKGVKHTLLLGKRDKVRRGIFAKRGEQPVVFVLEEEVMKRVPRKLMDLLEKQEEAS